MFVGHRHDSCESYGYLVQSTDPVHHKKPLPTCNPYVADREKHADHCCPGTCCRTSGIPVRPRRADYARTRRPPAEFGIRDSGLETST